MRILAVPAPRSPPAAAGKAGAARTSTAVAAALGRVTSGCAGSTKGVTAAAAAVGERTPAISVSVGERTPAAAPAESPEPNAGPDARGIPRAESGRCGNGPRTATRDGTGPEAETGAETAAKRRESAVLAKNTNATIDNAAATAPPFASRSRAAGHSRIRHGDDGSGPPPCPRGPAGWNGRDGRDNGSAPPARRAAVASRTRS